jgi:large subunit ribosomal protein L25
MATFTVNAETRADMGKGASRRLRRAKRVPAIMYGKGHEPQALTLGHDEVIRSLENEAFYSSILTIKVGNNEAKAVLRDLQRHPFRAVIMHVDFQRINENEKLQMRVPLHFSGQELAPGTKNGGLFAHVMTDILISCLPKDLPEYIVADVSQLDVGDTLHISDLKLPAGVESVELAHGIEHDLPVVSVHVPRAQEEEVGAPTAPAAPEAIAQAAPEAAGGGEKKGEKK